MIPHRMLVLIFMSVLGGFAPAFAGDDAPCKRERTDAAAFPACVPLPLEIGAAVVVRDLEKIDEAGQSFEAKVDVRLRWTDPRQMFDGLSSLEVRRDFLAKDADAKIETIWKPEIAFSNALDAVKQLDSSLSIQQDGTVIWTRRLTGRFRAELALTDFPFDEQELAVRMTIANLPARTLRFVHRDMDRRRTLLTSGVGNDTWSFSRLSVAATEVPAINGDQTSQLVTSVRAKRHPTSYVPQIFLPLLVTSFLPLLAMWVMKTELHERINWLITGVFSLIALNFSVSLQYPALPPDSLVMKFFWMGYGLQCVMLAIMLLVYNEGFSETLFSRWTGDAVRGWLRWAVPVTLVTMMGWVMVLSAW